MIDEPPALRRAMAIHGAQSITLVSLSTGEAIWSAGDETVVGGIVAEMVSIATRVVGLTDGGTMLDDLVLSSVSWFHVMRIGVAPRQGPSVVHLILDRRVANLSLARRELKALVDTTFQQPQLQSAAAPAAPIELSTAPLRPLPAGLPVGLPIDLLPHRTSTKTEATIEEPRERGAPGLPTWLEQFAGQPFETDTHTIERVLAGLRGLRM